MTYNDIMSIGDLEEKDEFLKKFYYETIKIDKWLINNYKKQTIKFKDRTEHKINGKYHNLLGPAIDYNNDEKNEYYIDGEKLLKMDWTPKAENILVKEKIKRIQDLKD